MQLVDTNRYPIDDLACDHGAAFLASCAGSFAETSALVLPGFLTPSAVASIVAEADALIDQSYFCASEHNVLLGDRGPVHDPADPMQRALQTRVRSIANDQLDSDGTLQQLYDSPALTRFIGAVLGYDDFYCGADPLGAVSVNVYGAGDMHEWHFDESRFSVTIMIQEAHHGGHFEFIPGLRSDGDAEVDTIAAVLDGDVSLVQRLPFDAGSLSIFGGRNTMHRVTEVTGTRHRLVPVLTYDTVPGSVNSDAVQELFWGRTA